MTANNHDDEIWQPSFYLMMAVSSALLMGTTYWTAPDPWMAGFSVGAGSMSVIGLLFLALQHWSLRRGDRIR